MTDRSNPDKAPGELVTPREAAERVILSVGALANLRSSGRGPVYYKVGRYVRYDTNDLDAWMRSRRFTSTSQESAAR